MEKVQKTDETGESKNEGINLKDLFGTPESKDTTAEKGEGEAKDTESPSATEEQDPKELQAKLDGVTKELARVRKGKAESSAEVQELREQLANINGQLEILSKTKTPDESGENRLAKYTDKQLLQGQTEWEDALAEHREAMRKARTDNDDAAYSKAARDLGVAKTTLNSIREELHERTKRVGAEQAKAQSEATELVQEISGLYENAYKVMPDLKDKDSALWQAGNEVFNRHPKLMKQLGPMAELVATSIALTEHPELLPNSGGAKAKDARKELLSEINAHTEKSLIKGKGTPNKKGSTDFNAMPKGDFEKMIHALKMGGGV